MTKKEAIEKMVARDFHPISQEWVKIIAEHYEEYPALPMWGTMWRVDGYVAKKLRDNSRVMELEPECEEHQKTSNTCDQCENYDEEMSGARCILDKDGNTTAIFIYEIDGQYLIGINGAGWDFYDGVWDKLYDLLGLEWHETSTRAN